jgi:hypothetical protein
MDNIENAIADIPLLRYWLEQLVVLSASAFTPNPQFKSDDDLAFMALSFAFKQNEHARSVLKLEHSLDAVLIVRSMWEGLTQLVWAAQEPDVRPPLWTSYAHIANWRIIRRLDAEGRPVDPEVRQQTAAYLAEHGPLFVTKAARKALKSGGAQPDDPYRHTWHGVNLRRIFEEVRAELSYSDIYGRYSEWHHWDTAGLGRQTMEVEGGFTFSSKSPSDTASALSGAFHCLLQTMQFADTHLRLGRAEDFGAIRHSFLDEFGRPRSGG